MRHSTTVVLNTALAMIAACPTVGQQYSAVLPEIAEWSISPDQLEQIQIRPYWILREDQWRMAVETGKEPLVLSQRVTVSLQNAWLPVRAVAEQRGDRRTITVLPSPSACWARTAAAPGPAPGF